MDNAKPSSEALIERENIELDPMQSQETDSNTRQARGPLAKAWLVWNARRFVGKVLFIGAIASFLLAFIWPKEYKATSRLMPPDEEGAGGLMKLALLGSGGAALGGGGAINSLLGFKSSGDLFVGVLRSRSVEDAIINRFDLRRVYRDRYYATAEKDLTDNTKIILDRRSGIIEINVLDRDPRRAAAIANEYVAQLDRLVSQLTTSSAHQERVFLEGRLVLAKQQLDLAVQELSKFSSKTAVLDVQEQGKATMVAGADLEGQIIGAQADEQALEEIYTPNNPKIKEARARIEELKRQLNKLGGQGSVAPAASSTGDSLFPSIRQLPLLGVKYIDLYRTAKLDEAIYETLTKEYELARVEEAKETPVVKVLDSGEPPERKETPHRSVVILVGSFLSLVVACVFVIVQNSWKSMDPGDERKQLALSIVGVLERNGTRWLLAVSRRKQRDQIAS